MDCAKIGRLISELRKEKGLTQQQLADMMNISNKTISKWECGLGCPDAALWSELATALGADIQKMLFYVCPVCGNILTSTGSASISCCGRKLRALTSSSDTQRPEISIQEMDIDYFISIRHDMEKSHYIAFAAYVLCDRVFLIRLYPEQTAEFRIPLLKTRGDLYVYCTRHGMQKYARFPEQLERR